MIIREAGMADASDIQRLAGVLGYETTEEDVCVRLERILADDSAVLLVAERDGAVHGFLQAEIYAPIYFDPTLNVLGLVVDTAWQGQGIGGQLLAAVEERARALGIASIRLNSGTQRHAAHAFYEAHGYHSNHEQKRFIKKIES